MSIFTEVTLSLLEGFGTTLKLFVLTLLFSLPLGFLMSLCSMSKSKWLSYLTRVFIWIIRGTPLMLQILVVFFAPGILFGTPIFSGHRFEAALITFVINYSCYFSEIYRSGIQSIPRGQFEAGLVLGLDKKKIMSKIIAEQVFRRILPPMSNEIITLVKDTSLVRVIAVIEIIKAAEKFASKGLIWPLFYTGIFYLVFSGLLTLLFGALEKKHSYYKI